jgi:hypothetical protein
MKTKDQILLEEAYQLVLENLNGQNKIEIFANGRGSDLADKYQGPTQKILIKDTLPNEPFKDTSYMQTSDNIKKMIDSINKGKKLPPIKVITHPYNSKKFIIVDGNHRAYAFSKSNVKEVDAILIPPKDVILMKSEYGNPKEELGTLDQFLSNKKVIDQYFVKPDGSNVFKKL